MRVFVLKYLVRKRTEKYAAVAELKAPTTAGITNSALSNASSGNLSNDAAKIMGVAKRKEKRAASS